ncbi:MAG: oligosaccharide flippase family protein [Terrimicrobiaceae bacterium]
MSNNPSSKVFFSRESVGAVPWILATKVVLFVAYFGISILIVRALGKEEYGVFALCKNIVDVVVILCGFGMNSVILRFVPELAVNHNRAGLLRLLWKSAALQLGASVVAVAVLTPMTPLLSKWFGVSFGPLIFLSAVSVGFILAKSWYNDVLTSLFLGKWVSLVSLLQGLLWAGLLGWLVARGGADIFAIIVVEIISIGVAGILAMVILIRTLRSLDWKSPPQGIGRTRIWNLGLAVLGGSIGRAFMMKYTETFFLGVYFGPSVVALYDLGYSSTMLVITFFPMALQTIFSSGLAEAYVKDPNCLPRLVGSLYKVLTLLSVPIAAFGVFYASRAVVLFYGQEMAGAGWVAAAFCVINLLPMMAIPFSMAVGAKEKVKDFLPLLYLRVGFNLLLDWILIPRFAIPGALAAVVLTFALTFPFRLKLVRSVLGGFQFPGFFFLKFIIVCPLIAAAVHWVLPGTTIPGLLFAAAVYFFLFFVALRFARLLEHHDVEELRGLQFGKLNRLLDLIVGKKA